MSSTDFSDKYLMKTSVGKGVGYTIHLCANVGKCPAGGAAGELCERCWASGQFSVVDEIVAQDPPVETKTLLPGDPSVLKPGSEALGVFLTAQVPNIAMTVGVETHRYSYKQYIYIYRYSSTLNPQPVFLNPQPSTGIPQPESLPN